MTTPFTERPVVYIAGPYTNPDPVENTNKTIRFADAIARLGVVTPIVPHLTLMWHLVKPHDVDYWYEYDLALLARCDALLRIPGKSSGADKEVEYAQERGIPVYYSVMELHTAVERGEVTV